MTKSAPNQMQSEWGTKVRALNLSQPDGSTCQSACIAMAVGTKDIYDIRGQLLRLGEAGHPSNMGQVLRRYKGSKYIYDESASISDMVTYLKSGEFLITHGWFTSSGHVIALDGVKVDENNRSAFNVKDPWSEFDGPSWSYNNPSVKFFDGFYSDRIIYAACVAGTSKWDAANRYSSNQIPNINLGQAWVHRILP
jgi:hypothetical protein